MTIGKENVLGALKALEANASENGSTVIVSASSPSDCNEILSALKEKFGSDCHLSSVAGNDLGDGKFEVNYILLVENVSVIVKTETGNCEVESVTKIFPGAILFERELYEMFGIKVVGHPDLRNFFLPRELTKSGTYPLRKSLTNEQVRSEIRRVTEQ